MIDDKRKNTEKEKNAQQGAVYSSKRVKIKIKERVSRKGIYRLQWPLKLFVLVLAAVLGFVAGGKVVTRYIMFWLKPHMKYRVIERDKGKKSPLGKRGLRL